MTSRTCLLRTRLNYGGEHIRVSSPGGLIPVNTWENMITCDVGTLYHTEDTSEWPKELRRDVDSAKQLNTGLRERQVPSLSSVIGSVDPALTAGLLLGLRKQHGESGYNWTFEPFPWRKFTAGKGKVGELKAWLGDITNITLKQGQEMIDDSVVIKIDSGDQGCFSFEVNDIDSIRGCKFSRDGLIN